MLLDAVPELLLEELPVLLLEELPDFLLEELPDFFVEELLLEDALLEDSPLEDTFPELPVFLLDEVVVELVVLFDDLLLLDPHATIPNASIHTNNLFTLISFFIHKKMQPSSGFSPRFLSRSIHLLTDLNPISYIGLYAILILISWL